MATDTHTFIVVGSGGKVLSTSENKFVRVSHEGDSWPTIPTSDKTPHALYGLSEEDLLRLGAEQLVKDLQKDPVEAMKRMGLKAAISTIKT